jgi:hypothetical protein
VSIKNNKVKSIRSGENSRDAVSGDSASRLPEVADDINLIDLIGKRQ